MKAQKKKITQTKKHLRFRSDEERLAAILKTAEEMAEPPGTGLQILVGEAVDAYWAAREEAAASHNEAAGKFSFVEETVLLARVAAFRMLNPVSEFFSDFFSTLAPSIVTVLSLGLILAVVALAGKTMPEKWIPTGAIILPLVLGASVVTALHRWGRDNPRLEFLTHSKGAIAGGALLTAVLLGYGAQQFTSRKIATQNLSASSYALAQYKLEDFAISSMERKQVQGSFLQTPTTIVSSFKPTSDQVLSFRTKANLDQLAVYEVAATGLNGQLVAEVTPTRGSLYFANNGSKQLRSTLLYGEVQAVTDNGFSLAIGDKSQQVIKLSNGSLPSTPIVGDYVIVTTDPESTTALKLMKVRD